MAAAPEPLRLFATESEGACRVSATAPYVQASLQRVRRAGRLVAQAQEGFASAVLTARGAACSWRQIGTAAGVPYQSLHRRFAQEATSQTPGSRKRQG